MRSYFYDKENKKAKRQYVVENISEAKAIFSLSGEDLDEIAEKVIRELDAFYLEHETQETEKGDEESYMLRLYVRDISRYVNTLDVSDGIALAAAAELGNQSARDHLICAHLKWAFKIAVRLRKGDKFDLLDIVQQANLGLVDAVDRWEMAATKGASFLTYAAHRVTGEIIDWLRGDGKPMGQVPRSIKDLQKKINWLIGHWKDGASPTPEELAMLCGVSRKSVISAILFKEDSLDADFSANTVGIENTEDSILSYIDAENSIRKIQQAIEDFSSRHTRKDRYESIIFLRLGFTGEMSLKKIGKMVGLTESRICQIMADFFDYLKAHDIQETTESVLEMQRIVAEYETA